MKSKKSFVILLLLAIFLPALGYLLICLVENKFVPLNIPNSDQWASLYGGLLSYVSACSMAFLALWQNMVFREENEKAQVKLQNMNLKLLEYQNAEMIPVLLLQIAVITGGNHKTDITCRVINGGNSAAINVILQRIIVNDMKPVACNAQFGLILKDYPITTVIEVPGQLANGKMLICKFKLSYSDIIQHDYTEDVDAIYIYSNSTNQYVCTKYISVRGHG